MNSLVQQFAAEANFTRFNVSDQAAIDHFVKLLITEAANVANDNFNNGFCPVGEYITSHFGVLSENP